MPGPTGQPPQILLIYGATKKVTGTISTGKLAPRLQPSKTKVGGAVRCAIFNGDKPPIETNSHTPGIPGSWLSGQKRPFVTLDPTCPLEYVATLQAPVNCVEQIVHIEVITHCNPITEESKHEHRHLQQVFRRP